MCMLAEKCFKDKAIISRSLMKKYQNKPEENREGNIKDKSLDAQKRKHAYKRINKVRRLNNTDKLQ